MKIFLLTTRNLLILPFMLFIITNGIQAQSSDIHPNSKEIISTVDENAIAQNGQIFRSYLPIIQKPSINPDALIFYDGFEKGIAPYMTPGYTWKPVDVDSSQIINAPTRMGTSAIQLSIDYYEDNQSVAAELRLDAPAELNHFDIGKEYWYAFSIYLPSDFEENDRTEIFHQFHNFPDTQLGEEWNLNPPFSLFVNKQDWIVAIHGDSSPVTILSEYEATEYWNLGPIQPGQWTDFVYNIKWSYGDDGIVKIWRDGHQIVNYKGANTYNDQIGPYMKFGIYEWYWRTGPTKVTNRTAVYDEIRVGNEFATYEMMVPENNVRP